MRNRAPAVAESQLRAQLFSLIADSKTKAWRTRLGFDGLAIHRDGTRVAPSIIQSNSDRIDHSTNAELNGARVGGFGWGERILSNSLKNYFRPICLLALVAVSSLFSACAVQTVPDSMEEPPPLASVPQPPPEPPRPAPVQIVRASWYGPGFAGKHTSSGERFDPELLTAASTSIPMGSIVRLMNVDNGNMVEVRINDCGPFVSGRSLDLSHRAARELGMEREGVASVRLVSIHSPPDASPPCND